MKVVTFGEIMMRLMPENYLRFIQADKFEITYAGAEANVAVSLSNFGINAQFVSKVPDNEIGQSAINSLRKYGVDTSMILIGGNRLGTYYVEKGASQRGGKVIYDRAYSSFSLSNIEEYDWDAIFDNASLFHFTGITPALGDNIAYITKKALIKAKEKGIIVSCDLNYRNKLWSKDKANEIMTDLMQYVDYLIANEEDAKDVFGIESPKSDINSGILNLKGYEYVAKYLTNKFHFKGVAFTLRESISASDNNWSGLFYYNNQAYISKKYSLRIVDRVGGGDSFGGGLIYSILNNFDPQTTIEFAVASSALKHSIQGDFNLVSIDEVKKIMNGNTSGRVQR